MLVWSHLHDMNLMIFIANLGVKSALEADMFLCHMLSILLILNNKLMSFINRSNSFRGKILVHLAYPPTMTES